METSISLDSNNRWVGLLVFFPLFFITINFVLVMTMLLIQNHNQTNCRIDFRKALSQFKNKCSSVLLISVAMTMLIGTGMILFILPGILLAIVYVYAPLVSISENKNRSIFDYLTISKELSKRSWRETSSVIGGIAGTSFIVNFVLERLFDSLFISLSIPERLSFIPAVFFSSIVGMISYTWISYFYLELTQKIYEENL